MKWTKSCEMENIVRAYVLKYRSLSEEWHFEIHVHVATNFCTSACRSIFAKILVTENKPNDNNFGQ